MGGSMMKISPFHSRIVRPLFLLPAITCLSLPLPAEDGLPIDAQPASDILMSYDLWGNPSPIGGVTNGGTTSHSVW